MSEENNMFEHNGEQATEQQTGVSLQKQVEQPSDNSGQLGYGQPSDNSGQSFQPADNGGQSVYGQQAGYGANQPGYGGQTGYNQQNYNQQGYSGQPGYGGQSGYNQYYGGQNQQTPLSGYAEPVYSQYDAGRQDESQGYGIASLICGILSLVTCCCCFPSMPLAVVSIVMGILQIKKGTAKGMAIAGIVCSAIGLVLMFISIAMGFVMDTSGDFTDYYRNYYRDYYDMLQELEDMNHYQTY